MIYGGESFFNFYTFNANNAISLKNITTDWSGEYKSPKGSFKVLHLLDLKLGYKNKNFSIAYILKNSLYIKASKDFSDLLYSVKQSENLDKNRIYNLNFNLDSFATYGIEISKELYKYKQKSFTLSLKGSFSLLKGFFLQNANIKGSAFANNTKDYSFKAIMDYYYSKNYFYNLSVKRPSSIGYNSSFLLEGEFKKYTFKIDFQNLLGYLFWENAPYSNVHLEAKSNIQSDKKYNPLVYGYEGKRNLKQKISPLVYAKISYNFDNFKLFLKNIKYKSFYLPSFGFEKNFYLWKTSLEYENRFHTLTFFLKRDNFSFTLGLENPNINKSKSITLGINFSHFL